MRRTLAWQTGADLAELPPLVRVTRCSSGEVQYFSLEDADLALAGIDVSDPKRRECRVYQCPMCQGWHLTGQPPRITGAV